MRLGVLSLFKRPMRFGSPFFYGIFLLLMFVAYAAVIALAIRPPVNELLSSAAANVLSLLVTGLCARFLLTRFTSRLPALKQGLAHLVSALTFSLAWYWLLMVFIGFVAGKGLVEFTVVPFSNGAAIWQLFQGTIMYALVAVATFAEQLARREDQRVEGAAARERRRPVAPVFVKQDDDFLPLDSDRIILVRGADDYCEIVTEVSTHLIRQRLGNVAERLGDGFVRVHRSSVVNVSRIARVEPTGNGTLQLVMTNGALVRTSRSGGRLLRQLLV